MFRKRRRPTPGFGIPPPFSPLTGQYAALRQEGLYPYCALMQIAAEDTIDGNEVLICRGFDPRIGKFIDFEPDNPNKPGIQVAKPYSTRGLYRYHIGQIFPAVLPVTRLGQNAGRASQSKGHPTDLDEPIVASPVPWMLLDGERIKAAQLYGFKATNSGRIQPSGPAVYLTFGSTDGDDLAVMNLELLAPTPPEPAFIRCTADPTRLHAYYVEFVVHLCKVGWDRSNYSAEHTTSDGSHSHTYWKWKPPTEQETPTSYVAGHTHTYLRQVNETVEQASTGTESAHNHNYEKYIPRALSVRLTVWPPRGTRVGGEARSTIHYEDESGHVMRTSLLWTAHGINMSLTAKLLNVWAYNAAAGHEELEVCDAGCIILQLY